jgi:hypothetical protein
MNEMRKLMEAVSMYEVIQEDETTIIRWLANGKAVDLGVV